jgi:outer membrane receptor for ferrienterochelin and colicin
MRLGVVLAAIAPWIVPRTAEAQLPPAETMPTSGLSAPAGPGDLPLAPTLSPLENPAANPPFPATTGSQATAGAGDNRSLLDLPLDQLAAQPVLVAEQTTTTLSRVAEKISEAPGSAYTFTRETIQKRGYRNLGELLQAVPGFTVFHRDLQFVAGVRGLNANDNEKITLLINGQELNGINEPDYLNGPINLDNLERVEVIVGPSSFFQRANTLAATINLITRDVDGCEAILGTGNALPYSGTFMLGHHWASDDYVSMSFTTERQDGFDAWYPDALHNNVAGTTLTGELLEPNFFSVLKRRYGDWTFQGTAYRTDAPELSIDQASPSNNGQFVDQFYSIMAKREHALNDTLTDIVVMDATYKQQGRTNMNGPLDLPASAGLEQYLSQMDYSAEAALRYTGLEHHQIQAGVQGDYFENLDCWFTTVGVNASGVPTVWDKTPLIDRDAQYVGCYLDDEYQATEKLKLIGGVRDDHNLELPGATWYTGIRSAIIYDVTQQWTVKALFNRAVRFPSVLGAENDAWGKGLPNSPNWATVGSPATEPEILATEELQNIFQIEKARLGITVYHEELTNFISWYEPHTNVGNFRGDGVELSAQCPLDETIRLWGNIAYNDSRLYPFEQYTSPPNTPIENQHVVISPSGQIVGSCKWTANVGYDYQLREHLKFSPSIRYFTDQAAYDYTSQQFETIYNRAYLDAALTWTDFCGEHRDLRLSCYNLLDNRSPVAGQWLADTYKPQGTTAVLTMYWHF